MFSFLCFRTVGKPVLPNLRGTRFEVLASLLSPSGRGLSWLSPHRPHTRDAYSGKTSWLLSLRRFICPKQEHRSHIDPLRNLLVLVEVFNILPETGKGPTFEGEHLHQDLCVIGIRKR